MARTIRNNKLDSRSARVKATVRREPYWTVIAKGCALGYRKSGAIGTWIARYRDDQGKQHYKSLGAADDAMEADNNTSLSYAEAQHKAEGWFKLAARGFEEEEAKPSRTFTVKDALTAYMQDYERRGGKSGKSTQNAINALILPDLGSITITRLTRRRIEKWHSDLANTAPRLRTKAGKDQKFRKVTEDAESTRRRRSSANRVLSVLKAALNYAHTERKVDSDEAWRSVKPFREVDGVRIRYLNDKEAQRLVNSCDEEFRPLVQAALLTGCRYGELTNLKVADYDDENKSVWIAKSKSGKARHIFLTDEGQRFFLTHTAGKKPSAHIFTKANGSVWRKSHQQRPFNAALTKAELEHMTFHELRHSYASRLIMNNVSLAVVAEQLGHASTRMVEKHYGHLASSHIAASVRAAFTSMGIVPQINLTSLRRKA